MTLVSTSLLNLSEEDYVHSLYNLETSKTDYFHIDVMDGKFVENNTSKRMKDYAMALSHISSLGLDVHLMVENVEEYIDEYIDLEPRIISFHIEAIREKSRVFSIIDELKRNNIRIGLAINPNTKIEEIKEYLPFIHMVLIMSVEPGKGGQLYLPETTQKISELKEYLDKNNLDLDIEVDGGINDKTAEEAVNAGASILVAGSYILKSENPKEAVRNLKKYDF
ncbi:MAG: ribulose-phosphate 3-epimerase [Clostridia bacterium]|nr:ribulose-phosphate 3-epimerase [Clostridia bacterium]